MSSYCTMNLAEKEKRFRDPLRYTLSESSGHKHARYHIQQCYCLLI